MDQINSCLFCKAPRFEDKKEKWHSVIICIGQDKRALFRVTVCPDCRKKHTIGEMYEQAAVELMKKMRETE